MGALDQTPDGLPTAGRDQVPVALAVALSDCVAVGVRVSDDGRAVGPPDRARAERVAVAEPERRALGVAERRALGAAERRPSNASQRALFTDWELRAGAQKLARTPEPQRAQIFLAPCGAG